ncbi:MAG: SGNH/GDSL hydrolase family protein [Anaerolineales bacterium]|nr:SGNH/GDSL hydrolase family protein [Anaerolineales bacterium]
MFSKTHVKLLPFLILLASLFFIPKMTTSSVQAAKSQTYDGGQSLGSVTEPIRSSAIHKSEDTELSMVVLPTSFSGSDLNTRRPEDWKSWNIVPSLSQRALLIYNQGLTIGNNPHAFSKVGDGEISAEWFLTEFDLGVEHYDLGPNIDLQTTVTYFSGSFGRQSQAARRGFNAQRVLDPSLADRKLCQTGESPLDCEIRIHRPSFALVSLGTNQVWQPAEFESGMRKIIETLMVHGVVPVLSTKADNLEGDNSINMIIARLAVEYDLPVWNFWLAVQPLPNHGLQKDHEHLTYFPNTFSSPQTMQFAWPVRNLSALQVLKSLLEDTQP